MYLAFTCALLKDVGTVGVHLERDSLLKAVRAALTWALEMEHVATNVARQVTFIKSNSEGIHAWTREDIHQFEAYWPIGSKPHLAMALMLYTGARRSDVITLGRQHVRDGKLIFAPVKTRRKKPGFRIEIPILPELQEIIDQSPTGELTFLVTEFGRPFTPTGFSNWFRTHCNEAGLPQCTAHGLRKIGATIMIDNGASEAEVMAWFGWENSREVLRYARARHRAKLAEGASRHLRRGKT